MKRNKQQSFLESAGWVGVVIIVAGYGLLALGIVNSQSAIYHALVFIGAIAVAAISFKKHDYQPAVLNGIFALFAIIALARILFF